MYLLQSNNTIISTFVAMNCLPHAVILLMNSDVDLMLQYKQQFKICEMPLFHAPKEFLFFFFKYPNTKKKLKIEKNAEGSCLC